MRVSQVDLSCLKIIQFKIIHRRIKMGEGSKDEKKREMIISLLRGHFGINAKLDF